MISVDWKGDIYPCIRYMESSLGKNIPPLKIGSIDKGIGTNENEQNIINELKSITRQSQSTEECLKCPHWDYCGGDAFHTWNFDDNKPNICLRPMFDKEYEEKVAEINNVSKKKATTKRTTKKTVK